MTTISLIALMAFLCIMNAINFGRKSIESRTLYKKHREEYRSFFGPHPPMKKAYLEFHENIFMCLTFAFAAFVLVIYFVSLLKLMA